MRVVAKVLQVSVGAMMAGIAGTNLDNHYRGDDVAFVAVSAMVLLLTICIGAAMFIATKKHFW